MYEEKRFYMNKTEHPALLTAPELKEILKQIQLGEKEWDGEDGDVLIASMLEHIGSTDSTLRDAYIYGTFCKLEMEKKLDDSLLKELLDTCLTTDMLFKGIRETGRDSVFTRSFTTLLVAVVLYSDNESEFLSEEKINEVKNKMIVYMNAEKDLRGFVAGKGWAHSIAHAADVFDELAKSRFTDPEMFAELLSPLWKKALVSDTVYIHDEEERILNPIVEMLKRGLDFQVVESLLQELPADMEKRKAQLEEENYWFLIANSKKFLKSFYIQIEDSSELSELQESIRSCLSQL
ncbi:DUF2785 domain-containing protein [Planococcus halotolerans]|uniref:DUF2785 domain-containing protein n=2 Tax=Planococcus halotolerans TaxID=2233542 RepID=A0A365L810_9BACL|nr:DUF2785 domain-containing protein [Planococcus halotolerans]